MIYVIWGGGGRSNWEKIEARQGVWKKSPRIVNIQCILSRATSHGAPWLRCPEDGEEGNGGTTSSTSNPCGLFAASQPARSPELLRPHWWAATIYLVCFALKQLTFWLQWFQSVRTCYVGCNGRRDAVLQKGTWFSREAFVFQLCLKNYYSAFGHI